MKNMLCNRRDNDFLDFLVLSFLEIIMREAEYQRTLIKKLQGMLPGCYILRNDPAELQGIPDILILFGNTWAMLEVKMSNRSVQQPNQDYYVNLFDQMSFASFINPDTEELVLGELQSALGVSW